MTPTTPCASCPWIKTNPTDGSRIPGYSYEKAARDLPRTVGDGDGFYQIMACHLTAEGADLPCRGYLAVAGYSNLWVRLLAAAGEIDMPAVIAATDLDLLYESFDDMLSALTEGDGSRTEAP